MHVAVLVVVVACALLGWWQLGSYRAAGAPARTATGGVAAPIESVIPAGTPFPAEAAGRRVVAAGRYDGARTLLVPGREHQGRTGFLVVTPLRTPSGVLPVHRGWVASAESPALVVPAGRVRVIGTMQPSETSRNSRVDPREAPEEGELPFLATPELMLRLPYAPGDLYEGYLLLDREKPSTAAAPEPVPAERPRSRLSPLRNLSYAAQWWFFGAAAVFFWYAAARRAVTERARPAGAQASHEPARTPG